jgi:hypothetical protein
VECIMITTYLSNVIATKYGNKCPYELLLDASQSLFRVLRYSVRSEL